MDMQKRGQEQKQPRRLLCFSSAFAFVVLIFAITFDGNPTRSLVISAIGAAMLMAASIIAFRRAWLPIALGVWLAVIICIIQTIAVFMPALKLDGFTGKITVEVTGYTNAKTYYSTVEGKITEINGAKTNAKKTTVFLSDGSPLEYVPGDILALDGEITKSINKYDISDGRLLKVRQTGAIALSKSDKISLSNRAAIFSNSLANRILSLLDGDEAGFLTALLCGNTDNYSNAMNSALKASGTAHIVAVSGMHVSILVGFFIALLGKKVGSIAAIPAMLLYAMITGMPPSVIRAVIMSLITIAAFVFRREADPLTSLFTALFVLLAVNPLSILSASLVMSFGATLGIILFSPMLMKAFGKIKIKNIVLQKIVKYITSCIATTISALAIVMPLSLFYFSRLSVVSILSNLLIIWAVSISVIMGIIMLLCSLFSAPIAAAVAAVVAIPLGFMVAVIKFIGSLSFAVIPADNLYFGVFLIILLVLLLLARQQKLSIGYVSGFAGIALLIVISATVYENARWAEISVFGNDGAVTMVAVHKKTAQMAGIGSARGGNAYFIRNTLADNGIFSVDTAVALSNGYKNVGALPKLEEEIKIDRLYAPKGSKKENALVYTDGGMIEGENGCKIQIIPSGGEVYALKMLFGRFSILNICGTEPVQMVICGHKSDLSADVLIVDSSYAKSPYSFARICDMAKPQTVIYSDDGYISDLRLRAGYSGKVLCTSETGAIKFKVFAR